MLNRSDRLSILNRLEKGEITPEEAARLLTIEEGPAAEPQTPMGVLEQVERGEINPEEATQRLSALAEKKQPNQEKKAPKVEVIQDKPKSAKRHEGWWLIFVAAGALLAVLAGLWMSADLRDGGIGFGFFCAWIPLSFGVLLLLFGWFARQGPWAHVRVKSNKAEGRGKVKVDVPLPIGVAGIALHLVGDRVPGLDQNDVDKLINALEQASRGGEPIHIQANSKDGENSVDISIS